MCDDPTYTGNLPTPTQPVPNNPCSIASSAGATCNTGPHSCSTAPSYRPPPRPASSCSTSSCSTNQTANTRPRPGRPARPGPGQDCLDCIDQLPPIPEECEADEEECMERCRKFQALMKQRGCHNVVCRRKRKRKSCSPGKVAVPKGCVLVKKC